MDIFNNREIAIAIWILITGTYAATKKPIRTAFGGMWQAFCNRKILVAFGTMAGYIALIVFALHQIGIWNQGQLKNTIFWSISVASVSLFRTPQIAKDEHYLRNAIKDNFKIVAILEFIVAFYTFPLWAELVIIPVATFLVAMQAYAEGKQEHAVVNKLLTAVLGLFGSGLVIYAVHNLVNDLRGFAQPGTLSDYTLPVVLSLLYLPFLFVFSLYVTYENAFVRLGFTIRDAPLRRFAKRSALLGFHLRTTLLKRWLRDITARSPASRHEVKASIAQVKTLAGREKDPAAVPAEQGWSPYQAREFLADMNLRGGDYHQDPIDDQQWFASSPYLEIGTSVLADNIAYYVEGDEHIARRLKLVVNFNNQETANETRLRFAGVATQLFRKALDREIPSEIQASIMADTPTQFVTAGKTVKLVRESWPTGRGYEMRLYFETNIGIDPGASGEGAGKRP